MEITSFGKMALVLAGIGALICWHLVYTLQHRLVFCDAGQGAATFIGLGTTQILIDTGPDSRVLSCIGKYMPVFDRTIEAVIISHNQKDHCGALSLIRSKYAIGTVFAPAELPSGKGRMEVVHNPVRLDYKTATIDIIKASQSSIDPNESANTVTIRGGAITAFLPSDINGYQLKRLIPSDTTVLEVPHHGSKYGLYPDSIGLAHPTLAVISVGKKNTYGHPSREVTAILEAQRIKIWRTDMQGELSLPLR